MSENTYPSEHKQSILVTGGAGYIGSHTCILLLEAGYEVVVVDNLSNSSSESLRRVENITGQTLYFYQVDLRNRAEMENVFEQHKFHAAIHFAALKAVGESMQKPLLYYDNNVGGTFVLLDLLKWHNVKNIVFSSSATVYGDPDTVPITETFPARPINPYGHSKLIIEQVMRDVHNADQDWNAIVLRYFNPVGAHPSGQIGEAPRGVPNNLSPYVAQVAVGERPSVQVFGDDYDTPDGTGMRDYIHIMDLAAGHLKALEKLGQAPGYRVYNLGTGRAYSVMEMIAAFEKASGKTIPHEVVARRAGDIATCYADPSLANEELGWIAARDLDEMVADAWRWQLNYPRGFETE